MSKNNLLPDPNDAVDRVAHPLAVEAILGLQVQGKTVNEEAVHKWLEAALGSSEVDTIARAMHFAKRIIGGPQPLS